MEDKKKKYTPILPYDVMFGQNYSMYDSLPYKKDNTVIGEDAIHLESGNVYKFYSVSLKEPCIIGGDR